MPVNNPEILIDHLDATLRGGSVPEAEALLQNDTSAREDWQYLQAAVDAIHHLALYEKVSAIREELEEQQPAPAKKQVNTITRNINRFAAAVVLLAGSLVIYKFATVNADGFFKKYYSAYSLPASRGGAAIAALDEAYRNADWNTVITTYGAIALKTNKDHFLAGMAAMELKEYPQAIERFTLIMNNNAATEQKYFQDEAEYYLALAYIANHQTAKAVPLIDKIKADANHLYRQKAKEMSGTDLKILELK